MPVDGSHDPGASMANRPTNQLLETGRPARPCLAIVAKHWKNLNLRRLRLMLSSRMPGQAVRWMILHLLKCSPLNRTVSTPAQSDINMMKCCCSSSFFMMQQCIWWTKEPVLQSSRGAVDNQFALFLGDGRGKFLQRLALLCSASTAENSKTIRITMQGFCPLQTSSFWKLNHYLDLI